MDFYEYILLGNGTPIFSKIQHYQIYIQIQRSIVYGKLVSCNPYVSSCMSVIVFSLECKLSGGSHRRGQIFEIGKL